MNMEPDLVARLARELNLREAQVERTVVLLDEGNTIPFITRYRKEVTGGLDEEQLRLLAERLAYLRNLEQRRVEVLASLDGGGHLTLELAGALAAAETLQAIEDIYLPFRPKRRTRAQIARELGLEPLAEFLFAQDEAGRTPADAAAPFLNEHVADVDAALAGARDIVAEQVAETAAIRQALREAWRRTGRLRTLRRDEAVDEKGVYRLYYEFDQPLADLPPHRILAINRGEREDVLRVGIDVNHQAFIQTVQRRYVRSQGWTGAEVREAVADGYRRLLAPTLERELRNELTGRAERHALEVFAANLRGLLLQPPLRGRVVLGIDPGYRTGCKLAVVDATGKYLAGSMIYLHQPERARATLLELIGRWQVQVIAIGNGTASRETEALVADTIKVVPHSLRYTLVSEAGASVYSASDTARREFPDLEASERGNISIARRLLDPLAELVKIDPKALGVGLYQHDVDQKQLAMRLGQVVESVVNYVGVDLNTASAPLLTYVAGLNSRVAQAVVAHRDEHGPFRSRKALLKVRGLGPKAFEQAAGFLRIPEAADPLDRTAIHPESYPAARSLLDRFAQVQPTDLPAVAVAVREQLGREGRALATLAAELGVGEPTLADILEFMARPGRDPREELSPPILRADVLKLEDLHPSMWLKGTVRNVVDFGAFVDIGVKQDGLVHISEMADRYVRDPLSLVHVGDTVDVRVLSVDVERGRIGLSMKR